MKKNKNIYVKKHKSYFTKRELKILLEYQDSETLLKIFEENNNYIDLFIKSLKGQKLMNIDYLLYLLELNKMIIEVLKKW